MAYQFLLVEDDSEIREIIIDYFSEKSEGTFYIDTAATGGEGLEKSMEKQYDLVLLDIMLPEVDGFTICRELRKNSDVPIIFITARHNESDRLHGNGFAKTCKRYCAK